MYAKDISKKIRSVLKEKQKQGEYMCSIPAYGYKRHPTIKNKLIVDEQVRDIVEKIFDMYSNGHGSSEIVNFLTIKDCSRVPQNLVAHAIKQITTGMK